MIERYSFEDSNRREKGDLAALRKKFCARLGLRYRDIEDPQTRAEIARLVDEFVRHNHLAVIWYEAARSREMCKQNEFRKWSIVLLIAIPAVTLIFSLVLAYGDFDATVMTVLISAILTSLIGVHRAIAAWMGQREFVAIFHNASAALKANIFDLEDKWSDRPNDIPVLIADLETGISNAKGTLRTEQAAYFAKFEMPRFDLGATISSASGVATRLTRATIAPVAKERDSLELGTRNRVLKLEQEIALIESDLEEANSDNNTSIVAIYEKRLANLRVDLAEARATATITG